jgi:hypothetical protein
MTMRAKKEKRDWVCTVADPRSNFTLVVPDQYTASEARAVAKRLLKLERLPPGSRCVPADANHTLSKGA